VFFGSFGGKNGSFGSNFSSFGHNRVGGEQVPGCVLHHKHHNNHHYLAIKLNYCHILVY